MAKDGKYWTIGEEAQAFVWFPIGNQLTFNYLLVRTTARPETVIGAIRGEFRNLDPNLPVTDVKPLTDFRTNTLSSGSPRRSDARRVNGRASSGEAGGEG